MADPTLKALRVLQVGIEATRATRVLTMDTQPTAADTITIGDKTYEWVSSGATSGQINRGADLAAAKLNLVAAINGSDSIQDGPNPYVTAAAFSSNNMTVTARIPGPSGNSIATTETFTAGTNVWAGTTLTGGAHARGTAVAATTKLAVESLEFGDDFENIYNPQVQNGSLVRYNGPGVPVQHGTSFSLPEQAAFWEHLPLWISMIHGAPAISGPLGGPYVLVWTVASDANPNPYSVTLQRRLSDGLGNNVDERATYCMLPQFGLSFAVNEPLKLSGDGGFARAFETSAITAAQTLPDFETMVSALSTVYFDTLFSDVGDTLLAEQVIGWSCNFLGGIFPRYTAEGRTGLDFTKHQLNGEERGIDMEITCLLDPATYAAEKTRASDPETNQFAVRIKAEGTDGRELTIDAMMQHDAPIPPVSDDQGSDVVTFSLKECPTSTDFLVITLTTPVLPSLT